jgi:hypothetical protein
MSRKRQDYGIKSHVHQDISARPVLPTPKLLRAIIRSKEQPPMPLRFVLQVLTALKVQSAQRWLRAPSIHGFQQLLIARLILNAAPQQDANLVNIAYRE